MEVTIVLLSISTVITALIVRCALRSDPKQSIFINIEDIRKGGDTYDNATIE